MKHLQLKKNQGSRHNRIPDGVDNIIKKAP